jgi:predicted Rossmann-fold nucleotide-binding protein
VEGYWDGLRHLIEHAVRERFVAPQYAELLLFADTPAELLDGFSAWRAPAVLRA